MSSNNLIQNSVSHPVTLRCIQIYKSRIFTTQQNWLGQLELKPLHILWWVGSPKLLGDYIALNGQTQGLLKCKRSHGGDVWIMLTLKGRVSETHVTGLPDRQIFHTVSISVAIQLWLLMLTQPYLFTCYCLFPNCDRFKIWVSASPEYNISYGQWNEGIWKDYIIVLQVL